MPSQAPHPMYIPWDKDQALHWKELSQGSDARSSESRSVKRVSYGDYNEHVRKLKKNSFASQWVVMKFDIEDKRGHFTRIPADMFSISIITY